MISIGWGGFGVVGNKLSQNVESFSNFTLG